jgi:PAS domain-containing protein
MAKEYLSDLEALTNSLMTQSEKLDLVIELCAVGVWDYYPESDKLIWNKGMEDIFEKEATCLEDFTSSLHDDDKSRVQKAVEKSVSLRKPYDIRYKIVTPSGIKSIHARGKNVMHNGQQRFLGVCVEEWEI